MKHIAEVTCSPLWIIYSVRMSLEEGGGGFIYRSYKQVNNAANLLTGGKVKNCGEYFDNDQHENFRKAIMKYLKKNILKKMKCAKAA